MFGGTPADFAVALGTAITIPGSDPAANGRPALLPEDSAEFLVYDSVGGSQVTDLIAGDEVTPIASVTTSEDLAALAQVPVFFGPDGHEADLWLSSDAETFLRVPPSTETLFERVAVVETDLGGLTLSDLGDVDLSGGADGEVLTVQADGSIAPEPAGAGTVTSVNNITPTSGNITLGPTQLSPAGATASGLAAVSAIVGARLLQSGAGYPARPAAAQWVHYIGTATPTDMQNGDVWDQPVVA